ncbi:FAD-binding monooxygenase [Granulosicoccus sp.]|nr:FAD-binding monooxygenase [Granulosicoccus sp.]MDB4222162.1 FAD-binding monooxygenase [Granulosicoccus sp.]
MQYHLDGFVSGDPSIKADASAAHSTNVDVLIVGCGPAGLTLAAQLSQFPSIKTRILEVKPGPLKVGQADGIACRTMEMFQAFEFAEKVKQEAYWVNEITFWKPDSHSPELITRQGRVKDTEDGLSEFPHVILSQARVHDFFLEVMRNSSARLIPEYSRELTDLVIDTGGLAEISEYPVTANFIVSENEQDTSVETIRAKYVVGCDGARSQVRQSIGLSLKGDSANKSWGVMDVLAVTDFPDIRLKSIIQSEQEGSVLVIPREGGYMVRLYIELEQLGENERVSVKGLSVESLIAAANRIFHPYKLDVKEVAWWSVYEIGQRITDKFDDVSDDKSSEQQPRVFIAGDACHTHSPKAGQGMNVSMNDSFNLGWKLASVIHGNCSPEILHSYSFERQALAQELIDFDRELAQKFAVRKNSSSKDESVGTDPAEFQRYFVQHARFTAGTETHYKPSLMTGHDNYQFLAKGIVVGRRFQSAPVIRFADAKPMQLAHVMKADGRWRIIMFASLTNSSLICPDIVKLCDFLESSSDSPIKRFTHESRDIDSVFDVRVVFQQRHMSLDIAHVPKLLKPSKGRLGLIDHEKIFCAFADPEGDIFNVRGIDREQGCMVVVRPDQHVAQVLPLLAYEDLSAFFRKFMLPQP